MSFKRTDDKYGDNEDTKPSFRPRRQRRDDEEPAGEKESFKETSAPKHRNSEAVNMMEQETSGAAPKPRRRRADDPSGEGTGGGWMTTATNASRLPHNTPEVRDRGTIDSDDLPEAIADKPIQNKHFDMNNNDGGYIAYLISFLLIYISR